MYLLILRNEWVKTILLLDDPYCVDAVFQLQD